MIEDILKSTKEQLLERISSPLIGSFVVAWSLWNYKFFVILFSAASVTQTFALIEQIVFPTKWDLIIFGMLAPLATTAFYLFLYPYPALFVFKYTKLQQRKQNEARQQIENETLLSKEESRKIYADMHKTRVSHQEEIDRLNTENRRLEEEIKTLTTANTFDTMSKLQRRLKKNEKPIPKVEAEFATENVINPTQYELLRAIEKAGGFVSPDGLRVAFGATSVQTDFNIQDLEEKGYIHKDYVSKHNGVMYQFTQPGRRALLEETQRRTFLSEQEKAALEWEGKVGANIKNSG